MVLGLVVWQAMCFTVILFRSIWWGIVRLRCANNVAKYGGAHLIFFFLGGFLKDLSDSRERIYAAVSNVAPQMLHRLNTGWTLRMPLMRFTEHKVKKFQFSLFVAIGFIY